MNYLIISDTHGQIENLEMTINFCKTNISGIIHCGDGVRDIAAVTMKHINIPSFFSVKGNMDANSHAPLTATLSIDNKKILVFHGHTVNIETILDDITVIAEREQAHAVLFGHTHIPLCKRRNNVLIINPGSLGKPRACWGPSFCILHYDDETSFSSTFYEISKNGNQFNFYEFTPI